MLNKNKNLEFMKKFRSGVQEACGVQNPLTGNELESWLQISKAQDHDR